MKPSNFLLLQLNTSLSKRQTTTHINSPCGKLGPEIHNLLYWAMLTLVLFSGRLVSLFSILNAGPGTSSPQHSCEQMHKGCSSFLNGSGHSIYLKPNTVGCLDTQGSLLGCWWWGHLWYLVGGVQSKTNNIKHLFFGYYVPGSGFSFFFF